VFRTVGGPLGPFLAYMPDGEVGDRRYWIDGIAYRVLNGHPDFAPLRRARDKSARSKQACSARAPTRFALWR
jgi:hypothetical protein